MPVYVKQGSAKSGQLSVLVVFFFFWLRRVLVVARGIFIAGPFVAAHGLFVAVCGLLSSCGAPAPEHMGSVAAVPRLSSCGAWAL